MKRLLSTLLLATLTAYLPAAPAATDITMTTQSQQDTDAGLAKKHPSELYLHAKQLFETGHKDDAVAWFYIGQLRWRYHLLVHPELPPDGEPAAMDALNATLGQAINEWAGGSPKAWRAAIGKALAWDASHPNPTTPKEQYGAQWQQVRAGLMQLDGYIRDNESQIRAERQARGLENR
ncbi:MULTISPECIES: hypothetical protein [unclassified Symbiopectobacterium]|uniref:hypothetical protein n=1 Tax=unclassified Symbiopectobacterium TaxID=2794573 RepID=UPI002227CE05|nr:MULTISPECIES: hypothetical protein [unclassified Symbiopectobacterium]MCW2474241.1 hypothetical protein [Candidatus Symbiopectobacterium sp. NZEC151]MCW2485482.1 hypothetical protein [Candidatus Symbiopectobacterium sp. NZEC127]